MVSPDTATCRHPGPHRHLRVNRAARRAWAI